MTLVRIIVLVALCVAMVSGGSVKTQTPQPLTPQAAQHYAADAAKAEQGDAEAAFRMAEAFESGRLGMKDLNKALSYYKIAAKNGHQEAAARATQLEVELNQNKQK
jgi:TPR repeat protein